MLSHFSFRPYMLYFWLKVQKKNTSQICISSLHKGHANLYTDPNLVYTLAKQVHYGTFNKSEHRNTLKQCCVVILGDSVVKVLCG